MKPLLFTLTFALTCLAFAGCSQGDADKKKIDDIKGKEAGVGDAVKPSTPNDEEAEIKAAMAKLPDADRKLAEAQKICPVLKDSPLGGMGIPIKVTIQDQPVFLCCEGCQKGALANPKKTLDEVAKLKAKNK
jgi:hypothetical protein